jgi:hypothetical protein
VKPDVDYMQRVLQLFEDHPGAFIDVRELERAGIAVDEKLAFHLLQAEDRGLIAPGMPEHGLGILMPRGKFHGITALPLRLTANGSTFLAALNQPSLRPKVEKAAESGLGVAVSVGTQLLTAFVQQQMGLGG